MTAPNIPAGRAARLRSRRWMVGVAVSGAAVALGGCGVSVTPARDRPLNGGVLQQPFLVPELGLARTDGRAFSTAELRGRWALFFFGYTTCPDVCPLTLANVSLVRRQLGGAAPEAFFVTVDPARDTPARLRDYMANFDPGIVALTGTEEQLAAARAAFGVVIEKRVVEGSGAAYFVDHTALVYLVNPAQQVQLVYPHGMAPADIVADLRRLIPR